MIQNRAQLAASIAAIYLLVMLGGIFIHFINTQDFYTLKFSLMLPSTWIAAITSGVAALGLWQRKSWAWWFGLSAVLVQLTRITSWLLKHFSLNNLPSYSVLLTLTILIIFLAILVFPGTRAACTN
jgi:translocator protein